MLIIDDFSTTQGLALIAARELSGTQSTEDVYVSGFTGGRALTGCLLSLTYGKKSLLSSRRFLTPLRPSPPVSFHLSHPPIPRFLKSNKMSHIQIHKQ